MRLRPLAPSGALPLALTSLLAGLFVCVTSSPALAMPAKQVAHAETPAQARQKIEWLYQVADAAYDDRNAEVQIALLAPDFVVTDEDGNKTMRVQIAPAIKKLYEANKKITTTQTYTKTTPTSIQVTGSHATVRWKGYQEAVSRTEYAIADVRDESTGEDQWVRTPAGWQMQRQHRLSFHRGQWGGITPKAALALQQVRQSRELLNQVIAGEQASDDQQKQIRIKQHEDDVWRENHGYSH